MATPRDYSTSCACQNSCVDAARSAQPEDRLQEGSLLLEELTLEEEPDELSDDGEASETEGIELAEGAVHIEGVPRSKVRLDARSDFRNSTTIRTHVVEDGTRRLASACNCSN
jgi:hypothetical protein